MTASLTPALALDYLRELSTDVRSAVVLDAVDEALAGDRALAPRAAALLAGDGGGVRIERSADGALLALRSPSGVAIAVSVGAHALLDLCSHDLRVAVEAVARTS